jgi:hypothetical protein
MLLVFAFWYHQKTGFEASEHNIDASHAHTARRLTLDALHTIRVAAFLARASPNRFLKTKRREERGEEREKRKRRKGRERGEREKRRQQTAPPPLNGPSAARAYELCSCAARGPGLFFSSFFARFSYVARRGIFAFLPARKCSKMHAKSCFTARRWRNWPILN